MLIVSACRGVSPVCLPACPFGFDFVFGGLFRCFPIWEVVFLSSRLTIAEISSWVFYALWEFSVFCWFFFSFLFVWDVNNEGGLRCFDALTVILSRRIVIVRLILMWGFAVGFSVF
ncbi:hypothetical protein MLD38_040317 [Melastoma candidum]|uniref:Uncharacterized protein n=1 Tax=Melastoma candidum TaxID=119954 RepID=A0ACB9L4W2_9MYRT|nr:hypothetical protein MLD38_040317 [Melastoma candidum]